MSGERAAHLVREWTCSLGDRNRAPCFLAEESGAPPSVEDSFIGAGRWYNGTLGRDFHSRSGASFVKLCFY